MSIVSIQYTPPRCAGDHSINIIIMLMFLWYVECESNIKDKLTKLHQNNWNASMTATHEGSPGPGSWNPDLHVFGELAIARRMPLGCIRKLESPGSRMTDDSRLRLVSHFSRATASPPTVPLPSLRTMVARASAYPGSDVIAVGG